MVNLSQPVTLGMPKKKAAIYYQYYPTEFKLETDNQVGVMYICSDPLFARQLMMNRIVKLLTHLIIISVSRSVPLNLAVDQSG